MPGPVRVVTGWYSWDYNIGPDLRAGGLRDSTPREVVTWDGPKGREERHTGFGRSQDTQQHLLKNTERKYEHSKTCCSKKEILLFSIFFKKKKEE